MERDRRYIVNSLGNVTLITAKNGVEIPTRIVTNQLWRNKQGQPIKDPKSIRRAIAHGYAGYTGSLVCHVCKGTTEVMHVSYEPDPVTDKVVARFGELVDCKMCVQGIPKNVCGDCQTPLPACVCVQKDPFLNGW